MERIYSRVGHLGRKGEFRKHERSDQRIRERILAGHGRRSATRTRGNDVQVRRITRKVHGEDVIWMDGQAI